MHKETLPRSAAIILLSVVIVTWGANWSIGKAVLQHLPPIWATALRTVPACLALWLLCALTRQAKIPVKSDIPVILSVSLLHMVAFSVLASVGLQYVPAGKSVVLAYTTPLWVLPLARYFLNETLTVRRMLGMVIGMAGLAVLLQPSAFDWRDRDTFYGHGLILIAAFCWAICIVYGRAHRWTASTFQLLPWQVLIAAIVQLVLALVIEGVPTIHWTWQLVLLLAYGSLIGTVLAYWAMNTVNRGLPASIVSMALLGVPVVGLIFSSLVLDEELNAQLLVATALIVGGIALGAWPKQSRLRPQLSDIVHKR